MNKKQKTMLARILAAAALLVALHFLPLTGAVRFVAYLIPYLIVGYDILLKAGKGIRNRQVFDECFLMAVATVGAIALALYEGSGEDVYKRQGTSTSISPTTSTPTPRGPRPTPGRQTTRRCPRRPSRKWSARPGPASWTGMACSGGGW